MHLTIENRHIPAITSLLDTLELSGSASRARTKLHTALATHHAELMQAEVELAREWVTLDEHGDPIVTDGVVTVRDNLDPGEYLKAREELLSEAVIVPAVYEQQYPTLHTALTDYPGRLSGDEARAYDALMDTLEHTLKDTP